MPADETKVLSRYVEIRPSLIVSTSENINPKIIDEIERLADFLSFDRLIESINKLEFSHAARVGKFYVSRNGFILKQDLAPYVFSFIGLDRKFEIKIGRVSIINLGIYSL